MSDSAVQYGMVVDTTRCIGCQTCTISCKMSNAVPGDIHWNRVESLDGDVLYQATGSFPHARVMFRPLLCNHCATPTCVAHCPSGAMHKDSETGIVSVDPNVCIGCGYCVLVCPYDAPKMNPLERVMSKCDLCASRIAEGRQPFCVESCPVSARIFGDVNDPYGDVTQIIARKHGQQYLPEYGTNPSVYYLL